MTVKEIDDLFIGNNIDIIGLNRFCFYGFGYFSFGGKFEILEFEDMHNGPWKHRDFNGTEDEFIKQWCNDVCSVLKRTNLYSEKSKTYKFYMELNEQLK